jgi:hypothetical protein
MTTTTKNSTIEIMAVCAIDLKLTSLPVDFADKLEGELRSDSTLPPVEVFVLPCSKPPAHNGIAPQRRRQASAAGVGLCATIFILLSNPHHLHRGHPLGSGLRKG